MEIIYSEEAQKDITIWKKSGNKSIQRKISQLLDAIATSPFQGIGKPEVLKHHLTGFWSRRINKTNIGLYIGY